MIMVLIRTLLLVLVKFSYSSLSLLKRSQHFKIRIRHIQDSDVMYETHLQFNNSNIIEKSFAHRFDSEDILVYTKHHIHIPYEHKI